MSTTPTIEDGLLARLSASGGRNIDLLKRAQDVEAKLEALDKLLNTAEQATGPYRNILHTFSIREALGTK